MKAFNKRITIYSQSARIIETLTDNLNKTINGSVDPSSIIIIDDNGFVPFTYSSPTNLDMKGKPVIVTKNGEEFQGEFISMDNNVVMIYLPGSIQVTQIRNYDTVSINENYWSPSGTLTLSRFITGNAKLSYIIRNISWNCMGSALIDNQTLTLILTGHIQNNTYDRIMADVSLVSGEVFQHKRRGNYERALYASPQPMKADMIIDTPSVTGLEDYTQYNVGSHYIIPNQEIVTELNTISMPITRLYVHNIREDNVVRFGYRFTATEFIPQCSLNVYSVDQTINSFLGTTMINESQKDAVIDIFLGESTKLQCNSNIKVISDTVVEGTGNIELSQEEQNMLKNSETKLHIIKEEFTVNITNHNTEQSFLIIKYDVGTNRRLLEIGCRPSNKFENDILEWHFNIPGGNGTSARKDTFSCTISTLSYR